MNRILFITSNVNKLNEAKSILKNIKIENINIDTDEIQSLNVDDVVKHKAIQAYEILNEPVLVEDTGLYIESLNNFPGALIKWFLKSLDNQGIVDIIKLKENKKAKVVTSVAFYDGKNMIIENGEIYGNISDKVLGNNGFGFDKIFIPENYNKTFAEMNDEEKNSISMRKIAFEKIKDILEKI